MSKRFYYAMPAAKAFEAMNALDDDMQGAKAAANTSASAAAGSAVAAATSATSAGAARDAAIAAWAASTAPAEQLAAISRSIHAGAIVDAFLYDTTKDSDGGAWRKRCRHTSWENEPLVSGKWLGQFASPNDALATPGAAIGDYYQGTVTFKFFIIGGTLAAPTVAEVYRGNTREFPALALIVCEAKRLVIYDATQPSCPMWMVFVASGSSFSPNPILGRDVITRSSIAAINGEVIVGANNSAECLIRISFISESVRNHGISDYTYAWPGNLAQRNVALSFSYPNANVTPIGHAQVSDVAMAVLPDAPSNPATGLPIPTIAAATGRGVSIIKHDGAFVNSSITTTALNVSFSGTKDLIYSGFIGVTYGCRVVDPAGYTLNGFVGRVYTHISIPAVRFYGSFVSAGSLIAGCQHPLIGSVDGLVLLKENPAAPAKGMVSFITNSYNSGWQVGAIRGAWLADTVTEVVKGVDLVTNGTFDANANGWAAGGGATLSVVAGALRVANDATGNSYGTASQAFVTVPGKAYTVTADFVKGTANDGSIRVGTTGSGSYDLGFDTRTTTGRMVVHFTATSATAYVTCFNDKNASGYGDYDNISAKLADPDYSVKSKGLMVNGSITKAPVAAGAQLVGYSGFSAANFLEQPYNSDLDFGTGDFCAMGWVNFAPGPAALSGIFCRVSTNAGAMSGAGFQLYVDTALKVTFGTTTGGFGAGTNSVLVSASSIPSSAPVLLVAARRSGVLELYVNGAKDAATTPSVGDLTNAAATIRFGLRQDGSLPCLGTMALWRISATAPSPDQIAQIYRDELALFQPNAKCTIDGASSVVTALAYDDSADLLHASTSWGRSAFKGLQRVESSATTVGAIVALSAGRGAHITAGAASTRYAQPAMGLRDELLRRYEARRAMAKEEIPLDFDGVAAQTDFTLPIGFTAKGVFVAGAKKRAGATKDYTVAFDGYRETVKFGVSPGATWVQITANRSI